MVQRLGQREVAFGILDVLEGQRIGLGIEPQGRLPRGLVVDPQGKKPGRVPRRPAELRRLPLLAFRGLEGAGQHEPAEEEVLQPRAVGVGQEPLARLVEIKVVFRPFLDIEDERVPEGQIRFHVERQGPRVIAYADVLVIDVVVIADVAEADQGLELDRPEREAEGLDDPAPLVLEGDIALAESPPGGEEDEKEHPPAAHECGHR